MHQLLGVVQKLVLVGWDYLLAIAEKQSHPHWHQFLGSSKKKAEIPSSQEERPMV
jgi:hypothetical protein